jgi:hypothetical protein
MDVGVQLHIPAVLSPENLFMIPISYETEWVSQQVLVQW